MIIKLWKKIYRAYIKWRYAWLFARYQAIYERQKAQLEEWQKPMLYGLNRQQRDEILNNVRKLGNVR